MQQDVDGTESSTTIIPERAAALFLLSYKEKFRLTQKAIDYAVGSVNTIAESVCADVKESIQKKFHEKGDSVTVDDITECCVYRDPFSNLKTEYLQSKFYRENFGLVVSLNSTLIIMYIVPKNRALSCDVKITILKWGGHEF